MIINPRAGSSRCAWNLVITTATLILYVLNVKSDFLKEEMMLQKVFSGEAAAYSPVPAICTGDER